MAVLRQAHRDALASVVRLLHGARDPWWVVAGTAVALHARRDVVIDDIDVLIGNADIARVAGLPGIEVRPADDDTLFRSDFYAALDMDDVTIEFMAGFESCHDGIWQAVRPASRVMVPVGPVMVPVPDRNDLIAMLSRFGRAKDISRIALLQD